MPARHGSKRLPGKNFRWLGQQPLWCWTFDAAVKSGCFTSTVLCTDHEDFQDPVTVHTVQGNVVSVFRRPPVPDDQPDIVWITEVLEHLQAKPEDEFMLLRPTSPFRGPETIKRAYDQWETTKEHLDSIRAVREASEPAWKQWQRWPGTGGNLLVPCAWNREAEHWHSKPTQSLPQCYIQTGALEIAWGRTWLNGTLSGERVGMFLTEGAEGLDLNTPEDWAEAEALISRRERSISG